MSKRKPVRRRTKGTGFIKARADGRRFATLTYAGRQYARAVPAGATKVEADTILDALRSEVRSGAVVRQREAKADAMAAPTFSVAAAEFLDKKIPKSDDKVNTRRAYTNALNRAGEHLGNKRVSAITRNDVEDCLTAINEKSAKATVSLTHIALTRLFKWLLARGIIEKSPVVTLTEFDLPTAGKATKRTVDMSPHQVRAVLAACGTDHVLRLYIEVLAGTGMRASEALALTFGALDWQRGYIAVVASAKGQHIGSTKTKSSVRKLPLGPVLAGKLRQAQLERDAFYQSIASTLEPDDLVFPADWHDARKVPADRNTYASRFTRACKRAGLPPGFSPHCLRHTFTTQGKDAVSLVDMAALLGHKDATMLTKVYAHASAANLSRAVAHVEAMIAEPAPVLQIAGPDSGTKIAGPVTMPRETVS